MATLKQQIERQLKQLENREYSFTDSKGNYLDNVGARIPKWVWIAHKKDSSLFVSDCIDYWQEFRRWPTPEQRILWNINAITEDNTKKLAEASGIDPRNISRYLKRLEERGFIQRKDSVELYKQKSGVWKRYSKKRNLITEKGKQEKYRLFKRY